MRTVNSILDLIKERKLNLGDGRSVLDNYLHARLNGRRGCDSDKNKLDVQRLEKTLSTVQNHLSRLDMSPYPVQVGDGIVSGDGENKKITYQTIGNRDEMIQYLKGLLV